MQAHVQNAVAVIAVIAAIAILALTLIAPRGSFLLIDTPPASADAI